MQTFTKFWANGSTNKRVLTPAEIAQGWVTGTVPPSNDTNSHNYRTDEQLGRVSAEIVNFITSQGLTPVPADDTQLQQAIENVVSQESYIKGLLTYADPTSPTDHIYVSAGKAKSIADTVTIELPTAMSKDITADWAVGTGNGCMPATIAKTGQFTTSTVDVFGVAADFLNEFKKNDVLHSIVNGEYRRVINFDRLLTGTFTSTGANVAGTTSLFLTEVAPGDFLYSELNGGEYREVQSVVTDLALILDSAFTTDVTIAENVVTQSPNYMEIDTPFTADVTVAENVEKNGLAPNITLHTFLMREPGGTVDIGVDTQRNAENILADATVLAAGYNEIRRTGSVNIDSSSLPIPGTVRETDGGGVFVSYNDVIRDFYGAFTGLVSLSVPFGISLLARVFARMVPGSDDSGTITDFNQTSAYYNLRRNYQGSEDAYNWGGAYMLTSEESQIKLTSVHVVDIQNFGYLDNRRD